MDAGVESVVGDAVVDFIVVFIGSPTTFSAWKYNKICHTAILHTAFLQVVKSVYVKESQSVGCKQHHPNSNDTQKKIITGVFLIFEIFADFLTSF